ncbi:Uncharacterised protein [Actinobacillus equuli]|nr:Uncharacterised protein [Actinobacillus equuli]
MKNQFIEIIWAYLGVITQLRLNDCLFSVVVWWEKRFIRKAKARLAATQRDTTA